MAMMPYFKVYPDMLDEIEAFSDAERGRILTAMLEYLRDGKRTSLAGNERYYVPTIIGRIDREAAQYAEAQANGAKGGRPRKERVSDGKSAPFESKTPPFLEKPNKDYNKDKDKDNNEDQDYSGRDGEGKADPIFGYAMDCISYLSPTAMEELTSYRADLGDDLVRYALDEAAANDCRKWSYVKAILENILKSGAKTVGEARAAREKQKAQRQQAPAGGKTNPARDYEQRDYSNKADEYKPMSLEELVGGGTR